MGSLADRLARLEQAIRTSAPQPVPAMFNVLFKASERRRAVLRGDDPPPYSPEEQAEMHEEELKTATGGGVVGYLRGSGGWEDADSRAFLDCLQDHARRRIAGGEPME